MRQRHIPTQEVIVAFIKLSQIAREAFDESPELAARFWWQAPLFARVAAALECDLAGFPPHDDLKPSDPDDLRRAGDVFRKRKPELTALCEGTANRLEEIIAQGGTIHVLH